MSSLQRNADRGACSPLVSAVVDKLTEMIEARQIPIGKGLPSERQLSQDLAVSRGVVRAAIRELCDRGLVQAKPRCRPVVSPERKRPPSSKKHVGIWLWPSTGDYLAASILKGIQNAGLDHDVRLIVAHASGDTWESRFESEARFLRSLAHDPGEVGAIVWYLGHERNLPALRELKAAGVPAVFIDRLPPQEISADHVGTSNESAARAGVRHLLELGHRRIGMITNIDRASSVQGREAGYRAALSRAFVPIDEQLIFRDAVDEPEGVEAALSHFFGLPNPPTAIFCINDQLALQAYDALQKRGVKIPQDISVLGFDGVLRWVPGGGHLTTLAQDFERIGKLAVELVTERMAYGPPDAYRHVLLDAPLHFGGSTAAPPGTSYSPSPNL